MPATRPFNQQNSWPFGQSAGVLPTHPTQNVSGGGTDAGGCIGTNRPLSNSGLQTSPGADAGATGANNTAAQSTGSKAPAT